MAKRSNGEGTIYHRSNGSWQAQVSIEGKRTSFTASTRKECQAWLKNTVHQVEHGLTFEGTKTTLADLLDTWLSLKENKLRLATYEQYRRTIRNYLKPGIGGVILKDLSAGVIQGFYSKLQDEETGKRSIEVVHSVLHGALKYAQRIGSITQNWAAYVEVPRPENHEMMVWNESQVSQFLISIPEDKQCMYRLAFATGMRRGELLGLKWEDLDWSSCVLKVNRQVYEPEGGGFRFQEPKTKRGRRALRLGPGMMESLSRQYKEIIPLKRSMAGERWEEYGLIFPSTVGTPRRGYSISKEFGVLAAEAGLPRIRFHDIRHTAASIMLAHNEPPVRVAALLGQSIAVLLDTYAHFIPGGELQAAMLMDQVTTPVLLDLVSGNREDSALRLVAADKDLYK